jgi:2-haloacid dehalogenase
VDRWASFDCYGTLIDWNAGIRAALAGIWPDDDPEALVASYHEAEPGLEADGTRS